MSSQQATAQKNSGERLRCRAIRPRRAEPRTVLWSRLNELNEVRNELAYKPQKT